MKQTVQCPQCGITGEFSDVLMPDDGLACPKCKAVFIPSQKNAWFDSLVPLVPETGGRAVNATLAQEGTSISGFALPVDAPSLTCETKRFQVYVAQELAKLDRARHELIDFESQAERQVLTKKIELNLTAAALAARSEEVSRRDRGLGDASALLAAKETDLNARESAVASRETLRATLEAEAADLGRLVAELRPAVERLQLRKAEAEAIRTDLSNRQSALDRRMVEVGRMELALQNRLEELDELEETLRSELEARERDLERQRRALDEEAHAARARTSVHTATPPPSVCRESGEIRGPHSAVASESEAAIQ